MIAAPHLLRKLYAELVTKLGSNLAGLKALISVIGDVPACFAKSFLNGEHFLKGGVCGAVHACDKTGFFIVADGFLSVLGVV